MKAPLTLGVTVCAYTSVTFDASHRRASLLLTVTLSALCEQLKLEIRGDAQAPDFSVAQY
jgi:hypothetical protein